MYIFTIQNTMKDQNDVFIYDDKAVHFSSLLRSFTEDALNSMVYMCLGEYLPLTDKTFRKCGRKLESMFPDEYQVEANILALFKRVQDAPEDVLDEVKELEIESQEDYFTSTGDEYVSDVIGGRIGTLDYCLNWVIYDDNTYTYELVFDFMKGKSVNISLKYKDGFDVPPSEPDLYLN